MTQIGCCLLLDAVSSSTLISPISTCVSTTVPGNNNLSSLSLPSPISHFPIFNMNDLETSRNAYSKLLQSAKSYRHALASMSISAGELGTALEACARLKEAQNDINQNLSTDSGCSLWHGEDVSMEHGIDYTADTLLAASGVHQLIANRHQILSDIVYRNLEVPLMHQLDLWQSRVEEEEVKFRRETKVIVKEIRSIEKKGLKLHKVAKKELSHFREHLTQLTQKTDALTELSCDHGRVMAKDCHEISRAILGYSATVVRAEVEVFETLARKGWIGAGLDKLMEKGFDIFSSEEEKKERSDNSSPSQSDNIIGDFSHVESETSDKNHQKRTGVRDSLVLETMGYQPDDTEAGQTRESEIASIFSESNNVAKCNSYSTRIPRLNSSILAERAKATKHPTHDEKAQKIGDEIIDETALEVTPNKITRFSQIFKESSASFIRDKNDQED